MSLLNKEPVQRVQKTIQDFNSELKVLVLETSARTAREAANSLNCEVGAIIKSLLFRTEKSFVLCLVSGDKKCSLNKIKKITFKKDISMANPEEVKNQTGYTIGGVSPVGHIKPVDIMIDNSLNRFNELYGAAGHPNCVFKINFKDLIKITKGKSMDITE
jgi:Cys-tRNA(Pro) deacylase